MDWIELIGYAGTALTVIAYAMRSSIRLRIAGILSSLAFLVYGALTQSYPIMLMEMVLLPLNLWRLMQMLRLVRAVAPPAAAPGYLSWLLPHMLRVQLRPGAPVFAAGDKADRLLVVIEGEVAWRGRRYGPGDIIGGSDLFDPNSRQSETAIALTALEVAVTPKARLVEAYFEDPAFGSRLVQLLLQAMNRELEALHRFSPSPSPAH